MFVKAVRSHVWLAPWLAVFVVAAGSFWFLCDDAYISFRFSRNWAHGLGLVFNPGEIPPVEGYSNFLWVALGALVELLGAPIAIVMPAVSLLCGIGLLVRVGQVAERLELSLVGRHLAVASLALSPAAAVWATSGLATMPAAWLFFELVVLLVLRERSRCSGRPLRELVVVLAVALSLLRVEGPLWVALIASVGALRRAIDGTFDLREARGWAVPAGLGLVIYALYTAWRVHHFGTWIPNTALVKVGLDPWIALRGAKYLATFALAAVVPVVAWAAALRSTEPRVRAMVVLVGAVFAYAIVVGGDFMPFGRLLVPALPLTALLLGGEVPELVRPATAAGLVGVGALAMLDLQPLPTDVLRALHFRHSDKDFMTELARWENQRDNCVGFARRGRALARIADPRDAVVAGAVGAIGYASGLEVLDQHGLVTKEVAYRPVPHGPLRNSPGHDKHVDPDFFVKYAPRFLYARTVSGPVSAGKMKDTLEQWAVPARVQDRYVPDFWEVTEPGDAERTFLVVVRRRAVDEDPRQVWNGFASRRRSLNAELRDTMLTRDDR